eukprot:2425570-Pleurochrysis_carterae.AAC.2
MVLSAAKLSARRSLKQIAGGRWQRTLDEHRSGHRANQGRRNRRTDPAIGGNSTGRSAPYRGCALLQLRPREQPGAPQAEAAGAGQVDYGRGH